MRLIIVESPTKAKTLARFLGDEFAVEATMGHIKDLPKSKIGVDIDNDFKPDYILVPKRAEVVEKLIKLARQAREIYLASDPDREGEAIAQHVYDILYLDLKPGDRKTKPRRITFHEITKEAVSEALSNPREIDRNLVDAQVGRRVLDRLVGYGLSPLLWRKVRRGLSAGRVQTAALRLIVEREKEIRAFKPEEYWEIAAEVKPFNGGKGREFIIYLIKEEIKDGKGASAIVSDLKKSDYRVISVKKREVNKNPYPPFTTSTMSQVAARIYGWSAKRTMSVAQRLYEEGLITYHRTDSLNLSETALHKVRIFIKNEYGENYLPANPRFYKTNSKVAQEAHEAIRPTNVALTVFKEKGKGSRELGLLYGLIWKRFVACQMVSSIYDETVIDVEAQTKNQKHLLRASGQILKFDGWKKLYETPNEGQILPELSEGEVLRLIKVISDQKFTEPPPRYNEASLIKTLEKLGIGRPSTYAPTISTVLFRNYVEKGDGKFFPTNLGFAVNDFLVTHFPKVFDYAFTAGIEDDLDKIASGEKKWREAIRVFWNPFAKKVEAVAKKAKRVKIETEKLGRKCPECQKGELVVRLGRFGKFISCSKFPDCKYTEKYLEKIGMKCLECKKGEIVIKKSGKGRKFFGCSRYPECTFASWTKPGLKKFKKNKIAK